MLGIGAQAGADRDRQALRRIELEGSRDQGGSHPLDGRLELDEGRRGGDQEELVGAIAAHHDRIWQLALELDRDDPEGLVAGAMAMVVVEEPEVVEIHERDAECHAGGPGRLDLRGKVGDQRAVVQGSGERITAGRIHEGHGLARQATLGRSEDQEQDKGGDEAGAQGDGHDIEPDTVQAGKDREGIAPHGDDRPDLAGSADRQELADHGRRAEIARTRARVAGWHQVGGRPSGGRLVHPRLAAAHRGSGEPRGTGRNDRPIEPSKLDAEDLARTDQGPQMRLEGRSFRLGRAGARIEVAELDGVLEDGSNRGRVAADDRVEGAGREVERDHRGLGRGRDPDDGEKHAVHQDQEQRPSARKAGAEHRSWHQTRGWDCARALGMASPGAMAELSGVGRRMGHSSCARRDERPRVVTQSSVGPVRAGLRYPRRCAEDLLWRAGSVMSDLIVAEGLVKVYRGRKSEVRALDGVDLVVPEGTVLGLLGPNGAGKTTTVRILATLLKPDAGRATIAGHDVVREPDAIRRLMGLSGQYAAVDENLTGHENLWLFGRLYRLPSPEAGRRADELLAQFDLGEARDRVVKTYSGGMRRRLDLASALITRPRLLILDEPTTGLDPRSRLGMWDVIRNLVREGVTLLLTTQYLEEADELADRIVVIDHGRIIARGTADELKSQVGGERIEVVIRDRTAIDAARELLARDAGGDTTLDPHTRRLTVPAHGGAQTLVQVVRDFDDAGIAIDDIALRRPTLDDVFLSLTGHASVEESNPDEPGAGRAA